MLRYFLLINWFTLIGYKSWLITSIAIKIIILYIMDKNPKTFEIYGVTKWEKTYVNIICIMKCTW